MNVRTKFILRVVGIALFAMTATASAQYGSISGTVTDAETGLPIYMAEVGAINMDSMLTSEAWTDTAGQYFIDSLVPGYYIVGAHKEGYEENIYPGLVEIVADEHLSDIDIELTFTGGTGLGSISGQVIDAETGLPISGAGISISGILGVQYTDSEGNYICDSIPDGTYEVSAFNEGYFPETYPEPVTVAIGETTAGIDFALSPFGEPGSISGTVIDATTELPIENVYISASGDFSSGYDWTDADGNYTITDLIAGDYSVSAWSESYWEQDYPDPVAVIAGQETPGIDFSMFPHGGPDDGIIAGQVLEEGTLEPVPLGLVIAYSDNDNFGGAFTDPDGTYMIQGLPSDEYYVIAMIQGYIVELYDGVYSWEEATPIIPDAYGIDFLLSPSDSGAGGISGLVSSDGVPLEGAIVCAKMNGDVRNSARSSADGTYLISGLSPGTYTITASMVSYQDASYPSQMEVGGDKIDGVDIELEPMLVGNVNGDGTVDIFDITYAIDYLYLGGPAPIPYELCNGDPNCDCTCNIFDITYLIGYLYLGGPTPCTCQQWQLGCGAPLR